MRTTKRILSMLLTLCFLASVVGVLPQTVFAAGSTSGTSNFTNLIIFCKFKGEKEFINDTYKDPSASESVSVKEIVNNTYDGSMYSVADYFDTVSNGKMKMQTLYLFDTDESGSPASMTLAEDRKAYSEGGYGKIMQGWSEAVNAAIRKGSKPVDATGKQYSFADLDKDGDGKIDLISIVYSSSTGSNTSTNWGNALWNYHYTHPGVSTEESGKTYTSDHFVQMTFNYANSSGALQLYKGEDDKMFVPTGVICHETMHALGPKDLYKTNGSSSTTHPVAKMSVMGQHTTAVAQWPSVKERESLGWLGSGQVKTMDRNATYRIARADLQNGTVAYKQDLPGGRTLYLEFRRFDDKANQYDNLKRKIYYVETGRVSSEPAINSGLVCYLVKTGSRFPNNLNSTNNAWEMEVVPNPSKPANAVVYWPVGLNETRQIKGRNGVDYGVSVEVTEMTDESLTFTVSGLPNSPTDPTLPVLSAGSANRTTKDIAEIQFTSSEEGTYYYSVVEQGAAAPTIDTTGAGAPCVSGQNRFLAHNLSAGAKDLYLVAKNAAGNVSDPLKIEIPAYTEPSTPTYTISANPAKLDFGAIQTGNSVPTEQTVTVTNAGNQPITLTQPAAANYTVGALSATSLAAGDSATFTAQPKDGLTAGTYNETITIQGENGSNRTNTVNIPVNFTVQDDAPVPPNSYTIDVSVGPAGGGSVSGGGTYDENAPVTVKAFPTSGHRFVKWTENGKEVSTSASYTFSATESRTLVAVFEKVTGEHTHTWGAWTSNGDGTHTRTCEGDASHTETEACSGGTATCHSEAVCTVCHEPYGGVDPDNHTGGTEVRGYLAPTVDSLGYTGDTYCKGCDTKIKDGTAIPKLDSGSNGDGGTVAPSSGRVDNDRRSPSGGGNSTSVNLQSTPVSVPVSGDGNTIRVNAQVDGMIASVKTVDLSTLDTVLGTQGKEKMVSFDLSALGYVVDKMQFPADAVKKIAAAANGVQGLSVSFPGGMSVALDAKALGQAAAKTSGADVTVSIRRTTSSALSEQQRQAVGNRPAWNVDATSSGKNISGTNGKITVEAPYELRPGEQADGLVVYYVDEQGNRQACETRYDAEKKRIRWSTSHLSVHLIGYDASKATATGSNPPVAPLTTSVAGAVLLKDKNGAYLVKRDDDTLTEIPV